MKSFLCTLFAISILTVAGCASPEVKGDVIAVIRDEITIKQADDSDVAVRVTNARDVKVLDSVEIEKKKAIVKSRLLGDDFGF